MDEEGAAVLDHLNYDASDPGDHSRIVVDSSLLIDAPIIVGGKSGPPLLYQGTGLVADKENPLVLRILTASDTAYSYAPDQPIKEVRSEIFHCTIFVYFLLKRANYFSIFRV